jgi:hypothetical protein
VAVQARPPAASRRRMDLLIQFLPLSAPGVRRLAQNSVQLEARPAPHQVGCLQYGKFMQQLLHEFATSIRGPWAQLQGSTGAWWEDGVRMMGRDLVAPQRCPVQVWLGWRIVSVRPQVAGWRTAPTQGGIFVQQLLQEFATSRHGRRMEMRGIAKAWWGLVRRQTRRDEITSGT